MNVYTRTWLISSLIIVSVFGVGFSSADASSFSLQSDTASTYLNESVRVTVLLDPEGGSVNTIRGAVNFDSDVFSLDNIDTTNSIIPSWIDAPESDGANIEFSAFIPNGFSGVRSQNSDATEAGELFTFTLEPNNDGTGVISVSGMEAFSGQGQAVTVDRSTVSVEVRSARYITPQQNTATSTNQRATNAATTTDSTPPEPFTPRIIQPSPGCGSPLFVSFQTSDADSGIDHYEIAITDSRVGSTTDTSWQISQSPHELTDIQVGQWVTVKAVDGAGNERVGSTMVSQDDIRNNRCQQQADTSQDSQQRSVLWLVLIPATLLALSVVFYMYRRSKSGGGSV